MVSEAQKKASAKYEAANVKKIMLKLNFKTDMDILEKLDEVDNVNGYIKRLIREDIKGSYILDEHNAEKEQ